jgi:hypothetical protein
MWFIGSCGWEELVGTGRKIFLEVRRVITKPFYPSEINRAKN